MLKIILAALLFVLLLMMGIVIAGNDRMEVEADVIAPEVSISVPGKFSFGEVKVGYDSGEMNITINNTGDVAVSVTPLLANATEEIFSNVYFKRIKSDSWKKIGGFSVNISKPASAGGIREQTLYLTLDLTDYNEAVDRDILDHKSDIIFWAVAQ